MDYARWCLARIVPLSKGGAVLPIEENLCAKELERLIGQVTASFFPEPYDLFFEIYTTYFLSSGGKLPDFEVFEDLASKKQLPGEMSAAELCAIYQDLSRLEVPDAKFHHALKNLIEEQNVKTWGTVLSQGMEILTSGKRIDKEELKGFLDSQGYVLRKLSNVQTTEGGNSELDARDASVLVDAYLKAQQGDDRLAYLPTGYSHFDDFSGGMQRGDLWVFAAHTGDGKSFILQNIAVNAATRFQRNVVIGTAEMSPPLVLRRIYSCHSRNGKFGLPIGIRLNDIKFGRIPRAQERVFFEQVIPDFQQNPDYGRVHIFQIPRGADIGWINTRLMRYRALFRIDLFVLDYLSIIKPARRRGSEREELDDVLKDTKQLALGFNNGEGLAIASAVQTNRAGYERALTEGRYSLNSLAGSAEIENSSDVVVFLLRTEECREQREITVGYLKNRDGEVPQPLRFYEDYGSAYIGELK